MKEMQIGQRMKVGFVTVECVAAQGCEGCIGDNLDEPNVCCLPNQICGACELFHRTDGKGVIFKIVETETDKNESHD